MLMGGLRLQKRLAAELLEVGVSRVWFDPNRLTDIKNAITKADLRKLINEGAIKALPEKMKKRGKVKKTRKGPGRRKGHNTREYEQWMKAVTALTSPITHLTMSTLWIPESIETPPPTFSA